MQCSGLEVKTSKAYVMRSLLPAKCRELVRAPDVSQAFAMLVLSLIDLSPSKRLSAGAAASPDPHSRGPLVSSPGVQVSVGSACAGSKGSIIFRTPQQMSCGSALED